MLTQECRNLVQEYDTLTRNKAGFSKFALRIEQQDLSDRIFHELFTECEPTEDEFVAMTMDKLVSARLMYRVVTGRYRMRSVI